MALPTTFLLTPADSAHVVGDVYGLSLLATLLLGATALVLVGLRTASAGTRALACRAAVVALLALAAGRLLPVRSMLWVLPEGLAAPLVALGKAQLVAAPVEGGDGGVGRDGPSGAAPTVTSTWLAPGLLVVYCAGVVLVLVPTALARRRLARLRDAATRLDAPRWRTLLADAASAAGLPAAHAERVQLYASRAVAIPLTWGGRRRPVVVLPQVALSWSETHQRATLVHELSHVRHGDAPMALAARLACALFWIHPGAWWLAARLSSESELACDDRVLLGGVRRSDYAELLALAQGSACGDAARARGLGVTLLRRGGVRQRVAAIVDTRRLLRAPSHAAIVAAMLVSASLAAALGTVRIAPTRAVLAALMHDPSWESRAYAVVRLAQRADSLDLARTAARLDPSPDVRAWARLAVGAADARRREQRRAPWSAPRRGTPLPLPTSSS